MTRICRCSKECREQHLRGASLYRPEVICVSRSRLAPAARLGEAFMEDEPSCWREAHNQERYPGGWCGAFMEDEQLPLALPVCLDCVESVLDTRAWLPDSISDVPDAALATWGGWIAMWRELARAAAPTPTRPPSAGLPVSRGEAFRDDPPIPTHEPIVQRELPTTLRGWVEYRRRENE